jgi:hypothetical protein
VLKGGNEGSWTVYGGIVVDRVALTPDKLRIAGRRIFFLFPKQKLVLFEFTRLKVEGPESSALFTVPGCRNQSRQAY